MWAVSVLHYCQMQLHFHISHFSVCILKVKQWLYCWRIRSWSTNYRTLSLRQFKNYNLFSIDMCQQIILCALLISDTRIKPVFVAALKKHPFILKGIDDVVKFDDVKVNRGQGYDPSTGVFTAPRKGLYHFSCVIMAHGNQEVQYQLNKNDARYLLGYSNKSGSATSTISDVVEMKKGDRVFIKHRWTSNSQEISGLNHSTFSGYFMQE